MAAMLWSHVVIKTDNDPGLVTVLKLEGKGVFWDGFNNDCKEKAVGLGAWKKLAQHQ